MLHRRAKTLQLQRQEIELKKSSTPSIIDQYLFPNLPDHYTLRKKIQITKNNTSLGFFYDLSQDFCTLLMCSLYITTTYYYQYEVLQNVQWVEMVLTLYIFFDLLLGWYLVGTLSHFLEFTAVVDALSVAPFFFDITCRYIIQKNFGYSFIQGVRTLRLVRVIRMFKTLRFFHSTRRAELKLFLTLACLVFIIAGLFQYLESNLKQREYDCQYIGKHTNWKPSCSNTMPADEMLDCDCSLHDCVSYYDYGDSKDEPSLIRCESYSFFTCVYYMVITSAGVGYGDYSPSTAATKGLIMFSILFSVVMIPPQINDLLTIISMKSNYKRPYKPTRNESHIILCGNVNSKTKLEQFFKEFFHPDRMFSAGPEYHVVILCPNEPSEAVKDLFISSMLDSRVTYVVGSALSVEDLKKVRADIASGMFFLCNTEGSIEAAKIEDATTVMRMLSVSNFNPDVECYVQVIRPEDRTILKDSDVEFILCLDEFKTTLIARNSICPGFSTFIENIFHTFGAISPEEENKLAPWYSEYLHGARMEMYYVPLDQDFLRAIHFDFDKLCEAIYIEYGIVVLALCNANQDSITFNPNRRDLGKHRSFKSFFQEFNIALIIADDNTQAEEIARGLSDPSIVATILQKIEIEEDKFSVRYFSSSSLSSTAGGGGGKGNSHEKDGEKGDDSTHKKRGLKRNRVITPAKSIDGNARGLSNQNSLFPAAALQPRILPNAIPKKILKHPADDFDSDESDPERNYIGYRQDNKGKDKIDEFQRSSIVYTKSHDTPPVNEITDGTGVKIVLNTPSSARRTIRSNSILQKINIPLVNTTQMRETPKIEPRINGSRAVRKSMAMPTIQKKVMKFQLAISEEENDSDDEEDEDEDEDEDEEGENDEDNDGNVKNKNKRKKRIKNKRNEKEKKEMKEAEEKKEKRKREELANIQEHEDEKSFEDDKHLSNSKLSTLKSRFTKHPHTLIHPEEPPKTYQDELLLHAASLWMLPTKPSSLSGDQNQNQNQQSHNPHNQSNSPLVNDTDSSVPKGIMTTPLENLVISTTIDEKNLENPDNLSTPSSQTTSLRSSLIEFRNSPTVADLKSVKLTPTNTFPRPRRLSPLKLQPTISEKKKLNQPQSPSSIELLSPSKITNNDNKPSPISGPQLNLVTSGTIGTKREAKISLKKVLSKPVVAEIEPTASLSSDYHNPSTPLRNPSHERIHEEEFKDQSITPRTVPIPHNNHSNNGPSTPLPPSLLLRQTPPGPTPGQDDKTPDPPAKTPMNTPQHIEKTFTTPIKSQYTPTPVKYNSPDVTPKPSSIIVAAGEKESLFKRALKSFKKPLMKRLSGSSSPVAVESSPLPSPTEGSSPQKDDMSKKEMDQFDKLTPGNYGLESKEVTDLYHINNHIIIFGNTSHLPMFIPELRRPSVRGDTYHPLVVVSPTEPERWTAIKEKYNDVYFLRGSLTRTASFNKANIDDAFAVILFCHRDEMTKEIQGVNEYNADSDTLFTYLKLEQYVPRNVFFAVELTCSENMAVLNSTIMRRVGRASEDDQIGTIVTDKQSHQQTVVPIDKKDLLPAPLLINTSSTDESPRKRSTRLTSIKENYQVVTDGDLLEENISRRTSISGNHEGRFTTKRLSTRSQSILSATSPTRKSSSPMSNTSFRGNSLLGADNLRRQITTMNRRISTIEFEPELEHAKETTTSYDINKEETFWDATDTHHMLPVFASARAYVPSSFMSLLVQSFFSVLTPLICEKLVCGQTGQAVVQIALPQKLSGRKFLDLYRVFCFHHVICFGLYRSPQKHLNALLPYIYVTPPPDTILFAQDRVLLYGKASRIARAIAACNHLKC